MLPPITPPTPTGLRSSPASQLQPSISSPGARIIGASRNRNEAVDAASTWGSAGVVSSPPAARTSRHSLAKLIDSEPLGRIDSGVPLSINSGRHAVSGQLSGGPTQKLSHPPTGPGQASPGRHASRGIGAAGSDASAIGRLNWPSPITCGSMHATKNKTAADVRRAVWWVCGPRLTAERLIELGELVLELADDPVDALGLGDLVELVAVGLGQTDVAGDDVADLPL